LKVKKMVKTLAVLRNITISWDQISKKWRIPHMDKIWALLDFLEILFFCIFI